MKPPFKVYIAAIWLDSNVNMEIRSFHVQLTLQFNLELALV